MHPQFLIAIFRFCSILGVLETQLVIPRGSLELTQVSVSMGSGVCVFVSSSYRSL